MKADEIDYNKRWADKLLDKSTYSVSSRDVFLSSIDNNGIISSDLEELFHILTLELMGSKVAKRTLINLMTIKSYLKSGEDVPILINSNIINKIENGKITNNDVNEFTIPYHLGILDSKGSLTYFIDGDNHNLFIGIPVKKQASFVNIGNPQIISKDSCKLIISPKGLTPMFNPKLMFYSFGSYCEDEVFTKLYNYDDEEDLVLQYKQNPLVEHIPFDKAIAKGKQMLEGLLQYKFE